MRIRKWATLSFTAAFAIMALLSLLIWQMQERTTRIRLTVATLDHLVSDFTQINNLANEYRLTRSERPKQQWFALHAEAMNHLDAIATGNKDRLLPIIRHDSEFLRGVFEDLVKYHERNNATDDLIMTREVTTAQFELRVRSLITSIETSRSEARRRSEADEAILISLFVASVVYWLVFISINTYLLGRRVLEPISRLRQGARIIGKGHLEHRVGLMSHDEMGDLSNSIDSMSRQLQLITTSRDSLEREIAERKKAEAELDSYRCHLEQLVAERTRELEQARDAAEAANRAKSIFLANMSHELRTPLNAILGFAQIMARDQRIPEDERRNIATINRSGNHLLALINDVLEISRIEAGRTTVTNEAFDLPLALNAVEEMIRVRAETKGLAFSVERASDLPCYVQGDVHHLHQVLLNLLGNAVKYTDRGRICLNVNLLPDRTIRFEVSDTGPGIAEDDQGRIFKAFYQTAGGIAKGEGTGLGLAISREFVRLMGGELTVTSELGKGSTFAFGIPLPIAEAVSNTASPAGIVGLAAGQHAPRILVAEDKLDNQQVVEQLLRQIGCEVAIAANGQEAVELFQSWHPQLILMDMRMPVMDGYQATRAIRSLLGGDKFPILALTASAFEEDKEQVLAAGCDEMLSKPIEAQRLFEAIGRALGLRFESAETQSEIVPAITNLADLPPELISDLSQAAMTLDKDNLMLILNRLRPEYPAEAELMAKLAEDFRFDRIQQMLRQTEQITDGIQP
ncbi:response regulator [Methylomonas sp. LL1]|uniref:ATP-binding protein n=1 Tax=Methylomonas sp. LL1 TaxID=2785785 RepID=UPI0018C405E8|nr:ATP-binding protein [Methylomonas sp. LL1]QPK64785.1 response regulator [Methylomonas sp. LL1]